MSIGSCYFARAEIVGGYGSRLAHVESVEKVLFLTNGRLNLFKFATFLGQIGFFYRLVVRNVYAE
jgi:hypothetical protein